METKHAPRDARQGSCSTAEHRLEAPHAKATTGIQHSFGLQPPLVQKGEGDQKQASIQEASQFFREEMEEN